MVLPLRAVAVAPLAALVITLCGGRAGALAGYCAAGRERARYSAYVIATGPGIPAAR